MDTFHPLNGKRILVVDDSREVASLIADVFVAEGAQIVIAGDVPTAMSVLQFSGADMVVTDLKMPGPDGNALLNFIAQSREELLRRTIVLTAYRYDGPLLAKVEQARVNYLFKPFEVEQLLELATQLMGEDTPLAA